MKVKAKILVLFGSLMLLLFVMSVGIASADEPHDASDGRGTQALDDSAPVGSNASDEGLSNGFNDNDNSNAVDAIANNPLCPAHPG